MRPIGKKLNTSRVVMAAVFLLCLSGARPVRALDVFTLWRQPEIPLHIVEGDWVEYRTQTMAGGRREVSLTRIVCLDQDHGSDEDSWLLELLPLVEEDGVIKPVPGEGVQLRVSRDLLTREGTFLAAIIEVVQWRGGQAEKISAAALAEDPLVAATLASDFTPDHTEIKKPTTRIVQGVQFMCDQFVMSAVDTQTAELPAGRLVQVTRREIVAAVHAEVPFLGLAFVSERVVSDSHLDPPSRRFQVPPARVRVEVMELIDFGENGQPVLGATD